MVIVDESVVNGRGEAKISLEEQTSSGFPRNPNHLGSRNSASVLLGPGPAQGEMVVESNWRALRSILSHWFDVLRYFLPSCM